MAARLKIVLPGGDGPDARRQRFYLYSAIGHVVVLVVFAFAPKLFGGESRRAFSDEFLDSIRAELVAEVPGDVTKAAQQVQPEVKPEPEPPKPQPVPEPPPETEAAGDVVHSKRADPTPAEKDPEPEPPRDPEPIEDPGDSSGGTTGDRVGDSTGGVQGGGEISLYGWYQSSVSRALYSTWRRPPLAGLREPLSVLISFEIRKDGTIAGLRVDQSSGVPALDRSALRAVADASPLPRLPPGWRGTSMTAAYLFELTPEDF